jgi:hypothetical protein
MECSLTIIVFRIWIQVPVEQFLSDMDKPQINLINSACSTFYVFEFQGLGVVESAEEVCSGMNLQLSCGIEFI